MYKLLLFMVVVSSFLILSSCSINSTTSNQTTNPQVIFRITTIQSKCLDIETLPFPQNILQDSIFYIDDAEHTSSYLWDAKTNQSYSWLDNNTSHKASNLIMSSNHHWLAYQMETLNKAGNHSGEDLIVIDAYGQQQAIIPWDESWGILREWLDNERLLIQGSDKTANGTTIMVNPFTQQSQSLPPIFPNMFVGNPPAYWTPSYDLGLSKVLYPNGYAEGKIGYSYWNIQSQELLWHQTSAVSPTVSPIWSPDRKLFAVLLVDDEGSENERKHDVQVVDNSGNEILQTNLTHQYPYINMGNFFSWSPDRQFIAFWLGLVKSTVDQPQFPDLVILNLNEKQIVDYCISGYGEGNEIVWAPGGRWFITWSDKLNSNILVDTFEEVMYQFPANGRIRFWMTKTLAN